jgi:hypothetical protein
VDDAGDGQCGGGWRGDTAGGVAVDGDVNEGVMQLLPVEYCKDVPATCVAMAKRRTEPMLRFYGRFIDTIDLPTLVASGYLQGVEDAWRVFGMPAPVVTPPVTDYQI